MTRPNFFMTLLACGLAVLCANPPEPAQAQPAGLGALAEFLPGTGQDGAWRFSNTGETFEIDNSADPGAIRYFYLAPRPGEEGRRIIEASIGIHPDSRGSAGLLYGLSQDGSRYHVLALDPQGMVSLFRRDQDGFRPMIETSTPDTFMPGKQNVLRIEERGDTITYALNGVQLGEVGGSLYGNGAVGIAAVGAVRAFYDGFDVATGDRSSLESEGRTAETQTTVTQTTGAASAGSGQALHLRRAEISDPGAPFGAMAAYATLIPTDWQAEGQMQWNPPNGCYRGPGLNWTASSPDKQYAVMFLPPIKWSANNFGGAHPGCLNVDLPDAETALRGYLDALGLELQVLGAEKPEELLPLYDGVRASYIPINLPNTRSWTDWSMLRVRGTYEGITSDSAVIGITQHYEMSQADAFNRMMITRGGAMGFVMVLATPAGALEQGHPAFPAILGNMRPNPRWQQGVAQWWQAQRRQPSPTSPDAGAVSSGTSVGYMIFESWKRREGMNDAGQSRSVNGILEVQPYQSSTGPILLSQNYNNAWELGDGSVVLTDDHNFNPMQTFGQFGEQMQVMN